VTLRYWGDYTCEEIAEVMGTTVNAVKSRLHRGRAALALLLADEESTSRHLPTPALAA
jgi:DNA-directed RNA polymerase specialized sigma24 family protein